MLKQAYVTLALAVVIALSGCGGSQPEPSQNPAAEAQENKPVVALIMKSLANEFFKTMEDGARAHQSANASDYELITEGIKDELDVNRQVQLVEQMVARGVDAIVLAPADSKALVAVCKRAQDKGVVVVNIDNKLDDAVLADQEMAVPFVGPDNRAGAKKVGDYLATQLTAGDEVAIIEGVPSAFNAVQRKLGFEDAMKAAGMNVITSQSAGWEQAKANQVVSALLTSHPELKAILCANDSMAQGAVSALRAAGKLSSVKVVGFDNISAAQALLKEGALLATADQHGADLAVFGIEYALQMLASGDTPADQETPVDLITSAS
ncbi:MAG: sugar ABC transporter substrate-binding protein [Candidatus Hydrogenedentes bacterium]|nr:sugar ABC transporter substrate-binding protein [Candidatus Hydrogenedentota bacterium]